MNSVVPRAERVTLRIPITYRLAGDDQWFQGRVLNISDSGVLFEPTALEPGARVEVIFSSPIPVGALAPGQLLCTASVARTTEAGTAGIRFGDCRFLLDA